jgi:hypothetical protein
LVLAVIANEMGSTIRISPLIDMGEVIAVIAVIYSTKALELIVLILVDVAPHALPIPLTAWHLGHDHVNPVFSDPPVMTMFSIGNGSLHKWHKVTISGFIGCSGLADFIDSSIFMSSSLGNFSHSPSWFINSNVPMTHHLLF